MNGLIRSVCIAMACSVSISCASGATYENAITQFEKGEYDIAFSTFRSLSEGENSNSWFYLGLMYNYGLGIRRDIDRAIYWYEKSALAGNVQAQHNLGVLYVSGVNGAADYDSGIRWLHESAQQGLTPSFSELGKAYLKRGRDLSDLCDAIYWYEKGTVDGSSIPETVKTLKIKVGPKCDFSRGQEKGHPSFD